MDFLNTKSGKLLFNRLLVFSFSFLLFVSCQKEKFDFSDSNGSDDPTEVDGVPDNQGITFDDDGKSATFKLFAPGKKEVFLIGDFNDWQKEDEYALSQAPDDKNWWVKIDDLNPSIEYAYQYLIDDSIRVADPYAHKVLDEHNDQYISDEIYPNLKSYPVGKTEEIVSVAQADSRHYSWKTSTFTRSNPEDLVIYELLVRDFVEDHSYQTLIDTLDYISRLGVNAIELMPISEFEGNDSWGYNPNFMFALDKYYGTPNDFKAFVDACHAKGIAVIQDIVLAHQFGSSPMVRMYANPSGEPSSDNPWFNTENRHPYAVGYQMNHESEATQAYVQNILEYWMKEYHIDGYRFDQSKGFTQTKSSDDEAWSAYDSGRIQIIEEYNNFIKDIDSDFYVILEHFAVDKEERELSNQDMMVWNNLSYAAQEAAMGYDGGWDLSRMFPDAHGFENPYGLVTYFESHDEERIQFKNGAYGNSSGNYNIKNISTGLKRDELLSVFLFVVPGPKMLWQFGERGYDISIGEGFERLEPKPPHWEYMGNCDRKRLYNVYSKMIKMKTQNSIFRTTNVEYDLEGEVKWINLYDDKNDAQVQAIGNFDVTSHTRDIIFHGAGKWYDNFSNQTFEVPPENPEKSFTIELKPGQYHLFSKGDLLKE